MWGIFLKIPNAQASNENKPRRAGAPIRRAVLRRRGVCSRQLACSVIHSH
jgi:hypothetical protein